ncbi:Uncharacterised protein [Moraxella lacunata]|uniref:Uncharacterized protein n=1 Tax=Moraxella lacunata TaxID=477 RepID=A0A378UCI1_MORLA|nr:helix-turn-helix domain-containing protein [Moraxella lacunata]STZ74910.1 Uncharacterised protein [Moraxella lacunata]
MPQQKLTKEMIRHIIALRHDEKTNWTYPKIRQFLLERYEVKVTTESIRKSYLKYKDDDFFEKSDVNDNAINNIGVEQKKPITPFVKKQSVNIPPKVYKSGLDETAYELSDSDILNHFKGD